MSSLTHGRTGAIAIVVAIVLSTAHGASQESLRLNRQRVTFKSGALTLVGYLFKPDGPGPFPALLWNHGSEQNPGGGPQFNTVASIFVPAGYVVFAPMRRGHSDSEGEYIVDAVQRVVDTTRLVVAGCSYGGIQTLLGAERNVGYRAAISISPAALSWAGNPDLRTRLRAAAARIKIPVFLLQPPKDASLEPARSSAPNSNGEVL